MIARTTPKTARKALHSFEAQPDPLGPDSLTWKYFGDLRTGMLGVWIGAIQNMYPELGAGVADHSVLLPTMPGGGITHSTRRRSTGRAPRSSC